MIFDKKNKLYKSPFSFGKGLLSDGKIISSVASGPPPLDPDAQAFITAAGITNPTQQQAINTLVVSLKGYGIWSKMKAIYPFVGGTASSHSYNLKNISQFQIIWNGGITHNSNGITGNGTNGFGNTGLIPSVSLTNNSLNITVYSRTSTDHSSTEIGCSTSGFLPIIGLSARSSNILLFDGYNFSNNRTQVSNLNGTGFYHANILNSTNQKIYKNGIQVGLNTSAQTQTQPTLRSLYILARNDAGTAANYSPRNLSFSSIGDGLTDTEASNLYTAVQTYQTTLGRSIGPQTVSDPDAQAFVTAANIQDQVQADAVNNLTIGLKADGLWSKMKAIYPFVGGDAASHKFNLKNPLDTDAAFRLVFTGGWTHSSTGALPNGTNGAANTHLSPSLLTNNNTHISVYSRTDSNGTFSDIGVSAPAPTYIPLIGIYPRDTNNFASRMYNYNAGSTLSTANTDSRGLFISNRTSSTVLNQWKNGIKQGTATYTNTDNVTTITQNIHLGAINLNGTLSQYSNRQQAFASIGDGLTDTEAANLYSRVQTYQTALNRQV